EEPVLVTFESLSGDVPTMVAAPVNMSGAATASAASGIEGRAAVGGAFTLSFRGERTAPIPADASAQFVEAALEDLASVDDVAVSRTLLGTSSTSGGATGVATWLVTFAPVSGPSAGYAGNEAAPSTATTATLPSDAVPEAFALAGTLRVDGGSPSSLAMASVFELRCVATAGTVLLGMSSTPALRSSPALVTVGANASLVELQQAVASAYAAAGRAAGFSATAAASLSASVTSSDPVSGAAPAFPASTACSSSASTGPVFVTLGGWPSTAAQALALAAAKDADAAGAAELGVPPAPATLVVVDDRALRHSATTDAASPVSFAGVRERARSGVTVAADA
ncbi:unnamed protein product, partial [Symbiodinium microadriaticum]